MLAFHVVCIAAVVAMVNLSMWQFHRLDQRRLFNSRVENRTDLALIDLSRDPVEDPNAMEWRRVGVTGTYRPDEQVLILNRSQGGRAGVNVVTPLETVSGSVVLVVRGFLPLDRAVPSPPSGPVTIVGTARQSDVERTGTPTTGSGRVGEFFRLDIDRIDQQVEGNLLPIAIYALASDPLDDSSLETVAAPVLSEGPHLSYAIQWLIFSAAVIVGWVLAIRRTINGRSRSEPSS